MARSPWPEPAPPVRLGGPERTVLRALADRAIVAGLDGGDGGPPLPDRADVPAPLWRPAGSFVTIKVGGELNGCIGAIDTVEPLARDVTRHAWSSAFEDPRLPALTGADYGRMTIEISILSELVPVPAGSPDELTGYVRTGIDGLLIEAGRSRAVFLPAVWATLPAPDVFVAQLLHKAGLDPDPWPDNLRAWRFVTDQFGDEGAGHRRDDQGERGRSDGDWGVSG